MMSPVQRATGSVGADDTIEVVGGEAVECVAEQSTRVPVRMTESTRAKQALAQSTLKTRLKLSA